MKFKHIFLPLILIMYHLSAMASSECQKLEMFATEEKICQEYQRLKKEFFQLKTPIDIEDIALYRSLRFIDSKDYFSEENIDKRQTPWDYYSTKTWIQWEKGNKTTAEKFDHFMETKKITLKDLADLHQAGLQTREGFLQKWYLAKNGDLRTQSFNYSILPLTDTTQLAEINHKNQDLFDGRVYFFTKSVPFKDYTLLIHPNPLLVEKEMNILLSELNIYLTHFKENIKNAPPLTYSPYTFISYLQKKFVLLHPFHEGNGRVSRYLQDILTSFFHLPFVQGGYLQDDILDDVKTYTQKTIQTASQLLNDLNSCLLKYKEGGKVPPPCHPLYDFGAIKKENNNTYTTSTVISHHIRNRFLKNMPKSFLSPDLDKEKVAIIQKNANIYQEDQKVYSYAGKLTDVLWVGHKMRPTIYNRFFKNHTYYSANSENLYGYGLYVSKNMVDSSSYSFSDGLFSSINHYPQLYVITIHKGQRYVDLHNEEMMKKMIQEFPKKLRISLFLNSLIRSDKEYHQTSGDRAYIYKKIVHNFRETYHDSVSTDEQIVQILYDNEIEEKNDEAVTDSLIALLPDEILSLSEINLAVQFTKTWMTLRNTDKGALTIEWASLKNTDDNIIAQKNFIQKELIYTHTLLGDLIEKKAKEEMKKAHLIGNYSWISGKGCYHAPTKTFVHPKSCEKSSPSEVELYQIEGIKEQFLVLREKSSHRMILASSMTLEELQKKPLPQKPLFEVEDIYLLEKWQAQEKIKKSI